MKSHSFPFDLDCQTQKCIFVAVACRHSTRLGNKLENYLENLNRVGIYAQRCASNVFSGRRASGSNSGWLLIWSVFVGCVDDFSYFFIFIFYFLLVREWGGGIIDAYVTWEYRIWMKNVFAERSHIYSVRQLVTPSHLRDPVKITLRRSNRTWIRL